MLCRSTRSGYEHLGANEQEYVVYKFLTRITLCCLLFAVCIIIILYASAYCCSLKSEIEWVSFHNLKFQKPVKGARKSSRSCEDGTLRASVSDESKCYVEFEAEKFDCHPEEGVSEEACKGRGCCWGQSEKSSAKEVPLCYYPKSYGGYEYVNVTRSTNGVRAFLRRTFPSPYPNDVKLLVLDAQYQGSEKLRVKIRDPTIWRYESLYPEIPIGPNVPPRRPSYKLEIHENKTGFRIIRNDDEVLFDAIEKGGFIFADQFLQISAGFSGKIYGIGEHQTNLQLSSNWSRFTLLNHDSIPVNNVNLYGSHPFYMVLGPHGNCHGVFLLNSNAMGMPYFLKTARNKRGRIPLPAITFRAIGGIFDFYFFMGPTPGDVIRQYTEIIGRPFMPPYWSLGFHISRLGYRNVEQARAVWQRTRNAGIPFDTQWNDIDYMHKNNDFTYDKKRYKDLPKFVKEIHNAGMHFIPILDPGISGCEPMGNYPPYDEGIALDIFIKYNNGSVLIGKVWNRKCTVFPDFTNRKTFTYWSEQIRKFHKLIPFDGLWIDMNEPSNFVDGSVTGCPDNNFEHPPYVPGVDGNKLYYKTICMSARQSAGLHYNLHNLYGLSEAIATNRALKEIIGKRPFVISRSTFPGAGRFAGHWSGDVASTWHDMKKSIPQLLSFSLFGIPMMGADICGFNMNTTKILCQRWSQLGAFYPFSRNHNTDDAIDQDPVALGSEVVKSAKNALMVRYTLLPYLYTLFWRANKFGDTVARPLFFEFWYDNKTHSVDDSFLWGCCLLIVPVLEEFATTVETYIPSGRWYDWYTGLGKDSNGTKITLSAPSHQIPVLIRGGVVLPAQIPNVTTTLSRLNKMILIATFNSTLDGLGSLYWDDGESLHIDLYKEYGLVYFILTKSHLSSQIINWKTKSIPILGCVKIFGFISPIKKLSFNGKNVKFDWSSTNLVLKLENLNHSMNEPFTLKWA